MVLSYGTPCAIAEVPLRNYYKCGCRTSLAPSPKGTSPYSNNSSVTFLGRLAGLESGGLLNIFRNQSIAVKLAIGFGLTLALTGLLALMAIRVAGSLNAEGQNMAGSALPRAFATAELQAVSRDQRTPAIRCRPTSCLLSGC